MSVDAPVRRPALKRRLRRGAYLLPSLFTIGNVLLGFYAVICGLQGDFQRAALVVFVAAITDSLDGRIARMTGTETEFGKEFDSLADVITFGVAPALLAYMWGVKDLAPRAWLVPLFYVVTTASRLARFNVQQLKAADSRFFVGLPAPAAAGAICSLLFFAPDPAWRDWVLRLMAVCLLLIGALMVSTFRYYSFKKLDLRRRWSYRVALPLVAIVGVVVYMPQATFLAIALVYTLSGPSSYVWNRLLRRRPGRPPAGVPALPPATGPLPKGSAPAGTAPPGAAAGGRPAPEGTRLVEGRVWPAPEATPADEALLDIKALPDTNAPPEKKTPPEKKASPDRKAPPDKKSPP
jgi:CDP-diacylglycerol--serine O-phosphatidyltransferase